MFCTNLERTHAHRQVLSFSIDTTLFEYRAAKYLSFLPLEFTTKFFPNAHLLLHLVYNRSTGLFTCVSNRNVLLFTIQSFLLDEDRKGDAIQVFSRSLRVLDFCCVRAVNDKLDRVTVMCCSEVSCFSPLLSASHKPNHLPARHAETSTDFPLSFLPASSKLAKPVSRAKSIPVRPRTTPASAAPTNPC